MPSLPALIQRGAQALVGEKQRTQGNDSSFQGVPNPYNRTHHPPATHGKPTIELTELELEGLLARAGNKAAQAERDKADARIERERQRADARIDASRERSADRSQGLLFKAIEGLADQGRRSWGRREYRGNGYWNFRSLRLVALIIGGVIVAILIYSHDAPRDHTTYVRDEFGRVIAVHHEFY